MKIDGKDGIMGGQCQRRYEERKERDNNKFATLGFGGLLRKGGRGSFNMVRNPA